MPAVVAASNGSFLIKPGIGLMAWTLLVFGLTMVLLARLAFPRITEALLPIGAYDPPWFMEKQHMNPEQAAQAFLDLGARTFVAMHWGTFKLTDEPLDEPPRRLREEWARRALPEQALRVPAIGETLDLC